MPTWGGRFPHDQGKRQLGYQDPVVTPTVSSFKFSTTAMTESTTPKTHATKSKQPKPTHTHKASKHASTKTGSYTLIGSFGEAGTSVPPFLGTNPTNPLGSCYLGTAYGCTSGGTGRLSPTIKSPPPIYPNTTSTSISSANLRTTTQSSLSTPSSSTASSPKTELPHGPPPHGPPPHGPPGGPPASPASSLSALEAGAVASPTTSGAGIVTYQNLVGYPIESGAVPPSSTVFAGGPPPGPPPGPPAGPPFCPPPVTITSTSTATVTVTEPAPTAPLTTPSTIQLSTAPFGLGNGTAFHGPTGGTGTGMHMVTIRTTISAKSSAKSSGNISSQPSTLTSATTSGIAAGKASDKSSTSATRSATAVALSAYT
ncbi:hypothetical protein HO133_009258 [Letharia lupina]|uniref:Uncharacterized protein n=1 Tax=Letharia lupina TaxID=560253 RepID=A0A8H6CMZ9_9LECA|nr:uncharacterized protein HO133_009258 [Letharia lupina]KAF6226392.1 hypothetical protein HO133_009258 [Letharia lupina]